MGFRLFYRFCSTRFCRTVCRRSGFTLTELSIVLVILGMVATGGLVVGTSMVEQASYIDTEDVIGQANQSIKDFYVVNGRLPCAAQLYGASVPRPGDADFGLEDCGAGTGIDTDGNVHIGMLPVRTLGLSDSAAQDKYGNRLLYAVTSTLTTIAGFSNAANDGEVVIQSADGTDMPNLFAYLVVSPGKDHKGAYSYKTGELVRACSAGDHDSINCDGDGTFRSAAYNANSTAGNFYDDLMTFVPKYQLRAADTASNSSIWTQSGAATDSPENIFAVGLDGSLDGDERVGIRTATPDYALDVEGDIEGAGLRTAAGHIVTDNANGALVLNFPQSGAVPGLYVRSNTTPGDVTVANDLLRITAAGNVGIGTADPQAKLEVMEGEVRFPPGTDSNPAWFTHFNYLGSGANYIRGDTYIGDAGGEVGIGGAPHASYKLQVVGDALINGGWLRVVGGAGLYFESYGGGWYMVDGTWIRSYGSKPVYMSNGFDTGAPVGVNCGGGLGGGYNFRVCGSVGVTGNGYANEWNANWITSNNNVRANAVVNAYGHVWSQGGYLGSDRRLKKNIREIPKSGVETLAKLRPVVYEWKVSKSEAEAGEHFGFIAQEVEEVLPEIVMTNDEQPPESSGIPKLEGGIKSVGYTELIPILTKAVMELKAENDALNARMDVMASKNGGAVIVNATDHTVDYRLISIILAAVLAGGVGGIFLRNRL